ncbi:hypothetical protein J6590_073947 [Homalodisca vitripennis]|nr:hypothetical protein J6590_073947 [Homalodisca vitripennis]
MRVRKMVRLCRELSFREMEMLFNWLFNMRVRKMVRLCRELSFREMVRLRRVLRLRVRVKFRRDLRVREMVRLCRELRFREAR